MSILFGVRKFAQRLVEAGELADLAKATERYAPDGCETKVKRAVGMGVQPYHTHRRSRLDSIMAEDDLGNCVCLDGRLDNVKELCDALGFHFESQSDPEIVLSAFRAYGEDSFARFVGDWAIVLWSCESQTLYLARDHAGTRTLHYEVKEDGVLWGTYLETFFARGQKRELNPEYVAAFLSSHLTHLTTPYEGIQVVPPAHLVAITPTASVKTKAHWSWLIREFIHYKTDSEYDEHFLALFRQAVQRRTGDDDLPILAELSGGMDSSAIVCVSDVMRKSHGASPEQLLDTVSYYDMDDPAWDEMPFVACVEERRQKVGIHLALPLLSADFRSVAESYLHPGGNRATFQNDERFEAEFRYRPHRVILSGLGGDELLGGYATGLPELSDLFVHGRMIRFARRSFAWCLPSRKPILYEWRDVLRFLWEQYSPAANPSIMPPPWCSERLLAMISELRTPSSSFIEQTRSAPSRIANGSMWWSVLETLPHMKPRSLQRREYRYPYLDRTLVEFLFRVPRERLVQPGRRRMLMRRALKGVVPEDILERKRKGYRERAILPILMQNADTVIKLCTEGHAMSLGLLNPKVASGIQAVIDGIAQERLPALARLVLFELWMSSASTQRRLESSRPPNEFVADSAASRSDRLQSYASVGNSQ